VETEEQDEGWKALTQTIRGDIARHGAVVGVCPYVGMINGKRGTGALIVYRDDYKALVPAETGADATDLVAVLAAAFVKDEEAGKKGKKETKGGEGTDG